MSDAITTLGQASREYEARTGDFEGVAIEAADAEVDYKAAFSKFKLKAIYESDNKVSVALAETLAMADDEVIELYRSHKRADAVLESATKRLQQLRERVATGRTYVASEREADRVHAEGPHT